MKTDINEFKRFHEALTTDRPIYKPWYFLLNGLEKDPLEGQGWKADKHQLSFEAATRALTMGYNIGIAGTDEDGLVIIDIDDENAFIDHYFKPTLTARSSSRKGLHKFYWTDDKNAKVNIALEHAGEVRSNWQYVVAPGSYAKLSDSKNEDEIITKTAEQKYNELPDSEKLLAGRYTLEEINPLNTITYDELPIIFKLEKDVRDKRDTLKENKPRREYVKRGDSNKSALYELEIDDVISSIPDRGRHPSLFHDSHTGKNTSISNGLLHCWRHNVSHNAISSLAVMAGLATCVDAGTGHKHSGSGKSCIDYDDGETIYKIWNYAKTGRYIPQNDNLPTVASRWYAINNGLCTQEDIIDGWRLPRDVYNMVLNEHGLITEQNDEINVTEEKESITDKIKKVPVLDEPMDNTITAIKFVTDNLSEYGIPYKTAFIEKYIKNHFNFSSKVVAEIISEIKNIEKENKKQDKLDRINNTQKEQPIIIAENIKDAAREIIYTGDPVQKIIETHATMHVGDEPLARALLVSIGIQSVVNSDGIHPKVSGDSGKGKTHCCKAMMHLLPNKYKFNTTLSDKAIYYMEIPEGAVVFSDDIDLSETLEGIIKRSTSNFQEGDNYTTLDKNLNVKELYIPPRISWWLTSVDDDQSIQLLNRQFGGSVDESDSQDEAVFEFQKNLLLTGGLGLPENNDVEICRCIIDDIKQQLYTVVVPFADDINWVDTGNRRNFMIFGDIIKAFAVLRHRQRYKTDDNILIASIEDFNDAKELYIGRAKNQGTKLTDVELKFCTLLNGAGEVDYNYLQKALGVSQGRISQIIHGKGKGDSGLINKVKGLIVEKQSVRTSDNITVQKKVCSLHNFNAFDHYETIVTLKTGAEERFYEHYPDFTLTLPEKNALPINDITYITKYILYTDNTKIVNSSACYGKLNNLGVEVINQGNKVITWQPMPKQDGKVGGNSEGILPDNDKILPEGLGNMPNNAQMQLLRYLREFKNVHYNNVMYVDSEPDGDFIQQFVTYHQIFKNDMVRVGVAVEHLNNTGWR